MQKLAWDSAAQNLFKNPGIKYLDPSSSEGEQVFLRSWLNDVSQTQPKTGNSSFFNNNVFFNQNLNFYRRLYEQSFKCGCSDRTNQIYPNNIDEFASFDGSTYPLCAHTHRFGESSTFLMSSVPFIPYQKKNAWP